MFHFHHIAVNYLNGMENSPVVLGIITGDEILPSDIEINYNKPLEGSLFNNQDFMEMIGVLGCPVGS